MNRAASFSLESTPLDTGVTLLEASAGTGKTFTIAGIVARLIAVENIEIRELLVVTFTEAATRELRDRIRRRIVDVAREIEQGVLNDPVTQAIRSSGIDTTIIQRRFALALASFDEATISTIHGFCQRVLTDHAFEGDAPFEAEIVADANPLLLDLAHDFWHRPHGELNPLLAAIADHYGLTPEGLAELSNRLSKHPALVVLPNSRSSLSKASAEISLAYDRALSAWRQRGVALAAQLEAHKGISKNKKTGFPAERVKALCQALDDAARKHTPTAFTLEAIASLTEEAIDAQRLEKPNAKKDPFPHDEIFTLCSRFVAAMNEWIAAVRSEWMNYVAAELPRLKISRGLMTFDDMLARMHAALSSDRSSALISAVRRQYRAALIDEFQDTDPIQYEIFRQLFAKPPHRLMLIGDPKQSIYGFRGADLFTYLEARRDAERAMPPRIHTLDTNFRAAVPLVEAVNDLFSQSPECFMQNGIEFAPVYADGKQAAKSPLRSSSRLDLPPMVLIDAGTDDDRGSADELRRAIARDIAIEIKQLTRDGRLGERAVTAADMAVLVRSHREAALIEDALRTAGIPAVRRTEASVFESNEARELRRILRAILEPSNDRLVRAALAASCFGLSAEDLALLQDDAPSWTKWLDLLSSLREIWIHRNFARMFRELLTRQHLRTTLLAQSGGERKLTNLLQLGELAQQAERELRLSPVGVVEWLLEQGRADRLAADDHLQRLEKDDDAVKIVTIHNSKGLEYPIVFCPSHWGEKRSRDTFFHDPARGDALTLDLNTPVDPRHKELATRETLAEEVRLFYVSITRAVHRCYLYIPQRKDPMKSALGRVLGDEPYESCRQLAERFPTRFELRALRDSSNGDVAIERQPLTSLVARSIQHKPSGERMIGSFSQLIAGAEDESAQDYDDTALTTDVVAAPTLEESLMSRLPRGAATGIALHSVLERADFRQPESIRPLVREHFAPLGLDTNAQTGLAAHLVAMMSHPLQASDHTIFLRDVGAADRLNEVEFFYPITRFTPATLSSASELPRQMGRLHFSPIDGFLRGFMDLVVRHDGRYYLIDWKSNRLGAHSRDYSKAHLDQVMQNSFYSLQSWLYTLALDRYLAQRLTGYRYERDFGGIFYIFVRGLDPAHPDRGVHYSRPNAAFVRRLGSTLLRDGMHS